MQVKIRNDGDVIAARREGSALAEEAGFTTSDATAIEIVISELATNILKYAGTGRMGLGYVEDGPRKGIEITCSDAGPGIKDIERAISGPQESERGLGIGLGGAKRLMDDFQISSSETTGTEIRTRKWLPGKTPSARPRSEQIGFRSEEKELKSSRGSFFRTAAITRAAWGAHQNGDAYFSAVTEDGFLFAVVDGLGHGEAAESAASEALKIIAGNTGRTPREIILACHKGLSYTRGAVIGVAKVNTSAKRLVYCGLGNIEAMIIGSEPKRHPYSTSGIVGHNLRPPREQSYDFSVGEMILIHSDGVSAGFRDALNLRSPRLLDTVESVAYEYSRYWDDSTILLAKWEAGDNDGAHAQD